MVGDQVDMPEELKGRIVAMGTEAYGALEAGEFSKAQRLFLDAFELLPEPRYEWALGEPLLADAAYAAILQSKADEALNILRDGLEAPVMNSPMINLRIGQAFFELGEEVKAATHFLFALLGGGEAMFSDEEPKYYAFAVKAVDPPEGCESWDDYEPPDEWPPDDVSEWFKLKLREPSGKPESRAKVYPLGVGILGVLVALLLLHQCGLTGVR